MALEQMYLGCPAWSLPSWDGTLFRRGDDAPSRLSQYASVFNTVEGNTTFYALPKPETVAKWREQSPEGFRFCFKFPKEVSHERGLVAGRDAAHAFLALLAPLEDRLGPFMLQLPPSFGPRQLDELLAFLDGLPPAFRYAVEVRHQGFFTAEGHTALQAALRPRRIDTVILDTRGLFDASRDDRHVAGAQSRKPRLPVLAVATGPHPIVRFVPHPEFSQNRRYLEGWRSTLRQWIGVGLQPFFFMHAPDDRHAPALARHFHRHLGDGGLHVGQLSVFPGEEPVPRPQLGLFGGS